MLDALKRSNGAFLQHAVACVRAAASLPGTRRLDGVRIVVVRHLRDGAAAPAAFARAQLPWPSLTNDLHAAGSLLIARRNPEQVVVIGGDERLVDQLLLALAPGRTPEAMAIDLSHGLGMIELHGPRLDDWLAHVVDACAIPAVGRASSCRLADVAVHLLRTEADSVRLVADRALFPYVFDWLAFSHAGAFEGPRSVTVGCSSNTPPYE